MNNEKNNTKIVFDIDGTLSVVGDRLTYLQQDKPDWDAFYEACGEDGYKIEAFTVLKALLRSNYDIYFVTGRRESVRQKTREWFAGMNVVVDDYHLRMRKDGDCRYDTLVKPELIEDIKYDVLLIFEDRNSMVNKWRELGYTCYQVAEGDF